MKKKIIVLILFLILILLGIFLLTRNNNKIKDGYMLVFHGEKNNIIYETYIYKQDNNKDNIGFDYINVTKKDGKIKVTKKGSVDFTDTVFKVAKENNAYDYVTVIDRDEKYTIEDFKPLFIRN